MVESATSDELKRLIALPANELLKEFTAARDKLRDFLISQGISVPSIDLSQPESNTPKHDMNRSILLDEFNLQTISAIDANILTVYSTANSIVSLFEKMPGNKNLEFITITIEGKNPCTAKDLYEQFKNGAIDGDAQIAVISSDLKALIGDLSKPLADGKVASLDSSDLDNIFDAPPPPSAPSKVQEQAPAAIQASQPVAPAVLPPDEEEIQYLPYRIEQNDLDAVMSGPALSLAAAPANTSQAASAISQSEMDELKELSAAKSKTPPPFVPPQAREEAQLAPATPATLGQDEIDALLGGGKTPKKEAPATLGQDEIDALLGGGKTPKHEEKATLDQSELDALLSGGKSKKKEEPATLGQNEIDALLGGGKTSKHEEKATLDQSELDALLSGGKSKKKEEPATLGQNEIDALLGGGKTSKHEEKATLDQSELDALLSGGKSKKKEEPATLGQNEIDALLGGGKTSKHEEKATLDQSELDALLSGGKSKKKEEPATLGQNEIDALLGGGKTSKHEEKATLDQSELDALLSGGKSKKKEEPATLGQNEIDALLSGTSKKEEPATVSQDDIDALLAGTSKKEEPATVSQDDIDALLAGTSKKEEPATVSQDDIDALLAGSSKKEEPATVSQDDIDALLAGTSKKEEPATVSQDDIDALLAGTSKKEEPATVSQDDIDALLAGTSKKEEPATVSQDDIDALLSLQSNTADIDKKSVVTVLSQSELDAIAALEPEKATVVLPRKITKEELDKISATPSDELKELNRELTQEELDKLMSGELPHIDNAPLTPDYEDNPLSQEDLDKIFASNAKPESHEILQVPLPAVLSQSELDAISALEPEPAIVELPDKISKEDLEKISATPSDELKELHRELTQEELDKLMSGEVPHIDNAPPTPDYEDKSMSQEDLDKFFSPPVQKEEVAEIQSEPPREVDTALSFVKDNVSVEFMESSEEREELLSSNEGAESASFSEAVPLVIAESETKANAGSSEDDKVKSEAELEEMFS